MIEIFYLKYDSGYIIIHICQNTKDYTTTKTLSNIKFLLTISVTVLNTYKIKPIIFNVKKTVKDH